MTTDGELLHLEEIASIVRVSVSTVRFWIRAGRLPSIRPGRRRLVRRGDFEAFLLRERIDDPDSTATTIAAVEVALEGKAPGESNAS